MYKGETNSKSYSPYSNMATDTPQDIRAYCNGGMGSKPAETRQAEPSSHARVDASVNTPDAEGFYFNHYEKCVQEAAPTPSRMTASGTTPASFSTSPGGLHCAQDSPLRLAVLKWTAEHFASRNRANDIAWKTDVLLAGFRWHKAAGFSA